MEEKYLVTSDDLDLTLDGKELIDFVKTAIVNNKDISAFTVNRIADVFVDECGNVSYIFA